MGDVHGLHIDDLQRHVANEDWTEVAAWNRRLQAALQDPTPADDIERHLARLRSAGDINTTLRRITGGLGA